MQTICDDLPQQINLDWVGPIVMCCQELDRIPAKIAGVYLLHSFSLAWGGYPVFYAGRTVDLRRRLLEHLDSGAKRSIRVARGLGRTYFSAAPVNNPHLLQEVEAALIRILRPPCNDLVPASSLRFVSLPPLHVLASGVFTE